MWRAVTGSDADFRAFFTQQESAARDNFRAFRPVLPPEGTGLLRTRVVGAALVLALLVGCGGGASFQEQAERLANSATEEFATLMPPASHDEAAASQPVLLSDDELDADLGYDPIEPAQSLVALDKRTGRVVWRRPRDSDHSYSTPLVIDHDGLPQIVSVAGRGVASYDPASGQEAWWCRHDGHTVVPRPIYGHGMIFVCTGYETPTLLAIDPSGERDVSSTHVRWETDEGVPFNASPLLVGTQLYLMNDRGVLSCYDAILGNLLWKKRVPGQYSASPVEIDGNVFVTNHDGLTTVIGSGDEFELLATNPLDGAVQASPAVSGKSLFVRTETHLYRIAESTQDDAGDRRDVDGDGDAPLDWPQFRGPTGDGRAGAHGVPVEWSDADGETKNIVWKTPVPGRGWSSPVVAGDQVWLTTAVTDDDGAVTLQAVCLNRDDGAVRHRIDVLRKRNPEAMHPRNSHATPTPVIDGDRVYVHFGSHGTACLTTDGELVWRTRIPYHHYHGPAGSPIVYSDLVVIACDGYEGPYDARAAREE